MSPSNEVEAITGYVGCHETSLATESAFFELRTIASSPVYKSYILSLPSYDPV
jgi:hypothetical protein